jgi:hypothetical protein
MSTPGNGSDQHEIRLQIGLEPTALLYPFARTDGDLH